MHSAPLPLPVSHARISRAAPSDPIPDIARMSLKHIQRELADRRVVCVDCAQKAEYVERLLLSWHIPRVGSARAAQAAAANSPNAVGDGSNTPVAYMAEVSSRLAEPMGATERAALQRIHDEANQRIETEAHSAAVADPVSEHAAAAATAQRSRGADRAEL
jgi:hypothetical protein